MAQRTVLRINLFAASADLAAAIAAIRRVRGDAADGDSAAVKQVLGHEPVSTAVQTGSAEDQNDLRANFRYEAEDQLQAIGRSLRLLETNRDQDNKEILRALRRSIHSLKGSSQSVGLKALTELTHRLEDLLDGITSDKVSFSRGIERLLFSTFDTITDLATGDLEEATVWERVNQLRDMFAAVISSSQQGKSALELAGEESEPEEALECCRLSPDPDTIPPSAISRPFQHRPTTPQSSADPIPDRGTNQEQNGNIWSNAARAGPQG